MSISIGLTCAISAYHGIPGRQNDRIARVKHLDKCLGSKRPAHDDLVNEPEQAVSVKTREPSANHTLVKPLVAHDQETLVGAIIPPRVLDLEPNRTPRLLVNGDT